MASGGRHARRGAAQVEGHRAGCWQASEQPGNLPEVMMRIHGKPGTSQRYRDFERLSQQSVTPHPRIAPLLLSFIVLPAPVDGLPRLAIDSRSTDAKAGVARAPARAGQPSPWVSPQRALQQRRPS
jgi:hypothetical protein